MTLQQPVEQGQRLELEWEQESGLELELERVLELPCRLCQLQHIPGVAPLTRWCDNRPWCRKTCATLAQVWRLAAAFQQ